jgi:pimeloyl-ACP methyl ester carboxylesterase
MRTDLQGHGRPMVMIGGGLTGWLSFIPHQQRLQETRRVARAQLLSVDLGLANRPLPAGYSVKLESAALATAIDELGLPGAVDLVAWSYGALVTLDFALDHPERVRTLTLIEPPAFWVLEATGAMNEETRRERAELEELHRQMREDVSEAQLAGFVRAAGLAPPGARPEDQPSWPLWVEHRRSLRQGHAVFNHTDDAARLRAFDRPVLLVKGTGSTRGFHRIIDALGGALPRSQAIELPGGHAPHIVSMDDFLAHLARFQDSL